MEKLTTNSSASRDAGHDAGRETDQRLSHALRWLGAISLISSAAVFMVQGLSALSSFERFLSFALLTAVLAVLGLVAGAKMKEAKSARTFLVLAAAATPVLFSQLGAMIHSELAKTASMSLPRILVITAPSMTTIALATAMTTLVMTPILYVGFGAYFRERSRELVGLLLLGSALLLLPTRDGDLTALMLAAQAVVLTGFAFKVRRGDGHRLPLGPVALMPLIPAVIMAGRELFYSSTPFFHSALALLSAGLFFEILPLMSVDQKRSKSMMVAGIISSALSWLYVAAGLFEYFEKVPTAIETMITWYPPVVALLVLAPSGIKRMDGLKAFSGYLMTMVTLIALAQAWNTTAAMMSLCVGALVGAIGFSRRDSAAFIAGGITGALGLVFFASMGVRIVYGSPWISLAVVGVIFILAAAWLEKNKSKFEHWKSAYRLRFKQADRVQTMDQL